MFDMFGNKGKDVAGLYKHSLKLVSKDQDLLKPLFLIIGFKLTTVAYVATMVFTLFHSKNIGTGFLMLLGFPFWVVFSAFMRTRYLASLSWMSYEVITGKDTDLDAGTLRLSGLNSKLFAVAMVNLIIKGSGKKSNQSFMDMLYNMVLAVAQGVWDIVQNFLLPALVIEKGTLSETVTKLKTMKANIPAAIAGTLGINLGGELIGGLIVPFLVIPAAAAVFLAVPMTPYLPDAFFIPNSAGPGGFNTFTIFLLVVPAACLMSAISSVVECLKTVYFTIYYTSLNHPLKIQEAYRDEVTNYLNFNNKFKGFNFFPKKEVKEELEIHSSGKFDKLKMDKVKGAFNTNLGKGHTVEKIKAFLAEKKFAPDLVEAAYEEYMAECSAKILPFVQSKLAEGHNQRQIEEFLRSKGVPHQVLQKVLKSA